MIWGQTKEQASARYGDDWANFAFFPNEMEDGRMVWLHWYIQRFVPDTEYVENWASSPNDRWIKLAADFAGVQHIRVGYRTRFQIVALFCAAYVAVMSGAHALQQMMGG